MKEWLRVLRRMLAYEERHRKSPVKWIKGRYGKSLNFEDSDDFIEVPAEDIKFDGDFTL